jgi:hypothetical protein
MGNNASQSPLQSGDCLVELTNDHTHLVLVSDAAGCASSFRRTLAPTRRIEFCTESSAHAATIQVHCAVCNDTCTGFCDPGAKLAMSDLVPRWNTIADTFEVLNEHNHSVRVSSRTACIVTVGGTRVFDDGDGALMKFGERAELQRLPTVAHSAITVCCTKYPTCTFRDERECAIGWCLPIQ